MGRTPCCEKVGLRRGRWTAEEDQILRNYIHHNGEGSWRSLPKNAGLLRCGKSCRLRWINYLRSDLKRGNFSSEEEDIIVNLHASLGNRWCLIAGQLPGRTDNEIKNYWNSRLSRKIHSTNFPHPNPQLAPRPPSKQPRKRAFVKNTRKSKNIIDHKEKVIAGDNDAWVIPMPSDYQESTTNSEEAWPSINIHEEKYSTGSVDSGHVSCGMLDDTVKHEDMSLMMIGTLSDRAADEEKANGGMMAVEINSVGRERLEEKKETPKREPRDHVEWEGSVTWGEDEENILSHWLSDIDNVNGVEKHKQMMAWLLS